MSDDELNQKSSLLFDIEAREAIQTINQSCLTLETRPGIARRSELTTSILRQTHNLKGAARALGREEIAALTHGLETLFEALQGAGVEPEKAVFDLIYLVLDNLGSLIKGAASTRVSTNDLLSRLETAVTNIRAPQSTLAQPPVAEGAHSQEEAAPTSQETIRVSVGRLDAIFNLVNELQVTRLGLEGSLGQMRHMLYESERFALQTGESPVARSQFNDLYRRSEANNRRLSQLLSQLQENVRQARMLPLATVFDPLRRTARNLASELGKEVDLYIEGSDIKLDRAVLEQIKSPLQHLLCNGIVHGLETPQKRHAAGKAETGQITMTAVQRGSSILIEMSDDGAGIDLAQVKEHAVRRGLLTAEEAGQLEEQETIWLLFQSGFSLTDAVTTVSGRGIGLDVVRQAVESLQGMISVENRPGQGVRFLLSLPVSIATSLCLLLQVNNQIFALPARHVTHLTRPRRGQVAWENGGFRLVRPGAEAVPAVSLAQLLGLDSHPSSPPAVQAYQTTVLIGSPEQPVALLGAQLLEVREVVIKKLPAPIAHMPYISGASILETGAVILVLSVTDLIRAASQSR